MVMQRKKKKGIRLNGKVSAADTDSDTLKGSYCNGLSDTTTPKVTLVPTTHYLHSVSPDDVSQDFARIVSVRTIAPTAEVEEFEEPTNKRNCETVIDIGEEEEILGLAYPHEQEDRPTFSGPDLDVGHFLCGGSGLDSLSLHDLDVAAPESVGSEEGQTQPALASCSTLWDNLVHLCEFQNCAQRASSKCAACLGAFYCGDEHQRRDWDTHRHHCSMYTKTSGPDGMVAIRDIVQGQELFSEKPLLLFPLVSWTSFEHPLECLGLERHSLCRALDPACLGCNRAVEFVGPSRHKCSSCALPLCSKACEYQASHKLGECQAIVEAGIKVPEKISQSPCFHALYMDVEILRALRLRKFEPTQYRGLFNLQLNSRSQSYSTSTHFRRFRRDFMRIAPLSLAYAGPHNLELIISLHAIITANSFRPSLSSTFKAIFRRQAEFNHSCLPNTVHYVENESSRDQVKLRLVTKAAVPIPTAEVLSIDFLPTPYLPHAVRMALLRDMGVTCTCPRCTRPHDTLDFSSEVKCSHCPRGHVRPEEPSKWRQSVWACTVCFEETPYAVLNRTENELSLELMQLPKGRYQDLGALKDFIAKGLKSLHEGHALIIHAWCCIESILRRRVESVREMDPEKRYDERMLSDCRLLLQYADTVLPHLEAIRQGLWVDKGLVLFHKFYAKFILSCDEHRRGRSNTKDFTKDIFKCLKLLDLSLQALEPFKGMSASGQVISTTASEASAARPRLKDLAARLIQRQSGAKRSPFAAPI